MWVSTVRVVMWGIHVPDVLQQVTAAQHVTRLAGQCPQQAKLQRGQAHLGIADVDAMGPRVDAQIIDVQHRGIVLDRWAGCFDGGEGGDLAPQHGLDAQQKLTHAERFDDIVISPDFKTDHAIDLRRARSA